MSRFARITAALPDRCRAEASLAGLCTWHIGGPTGPVLDSLRDQYADAQQAQ